MGKVRDTAELLYESKSLLGFAVTDIAGDIIHNESFFCDEAAENALAILTGCVDQLKNSDRIVNRLTIELDDVILIYTRITDPDQHGMFILNPNCDLDASAKTIHTLAT